MVGHLSTRRTAVHIPTLISKLCVSKYIHNYTWHLKKINLARYYWVCNIKLFSLFTVKICMRFTIRFLRILTNMMITDYSNNENIIWPLGICSKNNFNISQIIRFQMSSS